MKLLMVLALAGTFVSGCAMGRKGGVATMTGLIRMHKGCAFAFLLLVAIHVLGHAF